MNRLYNPKHPAVKTRTKEIFDEINTLILNKESLTFSESAGILLVNGQEIKEQSHLINQVIQSFRTLGFGSLIVESGLSLEEFDSLIYLLHHAKDIQGEGRVKQYLKEKDIKHLVYSLATYKLVKEDEAIVKEREAAKALCAEKFSPFLSKITADLTKDTPEELIKTLWLIGDHLLGEAAATAKGEEANRKSLDGLKAHLLSLWEKKPDKERWKGETEKTFTAINAALEIKRLILLYKKHKKGLETITNKLSKILKLLPPESQLYFKTMEELAKMGSELFKKESI
ncbi:MAG: hypothetical protein KJ842_04835 [Candidatus Omnitrophica bacterium]|nr:hypothetical protein [Candidatus Omnitrophota bacterium]